MKILILISLLIIVSSCNQKKSDTDVMNKVAENYVKLVLELGLYDKSMVDAYFGPEEFKTGLVKEKSVPKQKILTKIKHIKDDLRKVDLSGLSDLDLKRYKYLQKQINAMKFRLNYITGAKSSFDTESSILYDAISPKYSEEYFKKLVSELNDLLPGKGRIDLRLTEYKKDFIIPKSKLDTVFKTAINEARKRANKYLNLPKHEEFKLQYVTDKVWSGYNWYQGDAKSLIQINTDFPIYIERAIDLACHEGYPGHHVYNTMLEKELFRKNGWIEFSIYALFSPQSLIAEGSGNYGIEVAFEEKGRMKFEKEILFPLAGLDAKKADKYYQVLKIVSKLSYAGNEAARNYLDGKMTANAAIEWLQKYGLYREDKAKQRLEFIKVNRAYVINYNLGKDLVKNYIESQMSNNNDVKQKWQLFEKRILKKPLTASQLSIKN